MTPTAYLIITIILSVAALVAMFFPRIPAVLAAYAALVCAALAGAVYVDTTILIYWGIATVIIFGLRMLQPKALVLAKQGNAYVAIGALAGAVVGYALSPTAAAMIGCSAVGAVAGAFAYAMTPAGRVLNPASGRFVEYLCAKGLPAVVTASMCAIAIATQL